MRIFSTKNLCVLKNTKIGKKKIYFWCFFYKIELVKIKQIKFWLNIDLKKYDFLAKKENTDVDGFVESVQNIIKPSGGQAIQ